MTTNSADDTILISDQKGEVLKLTLNRPSRLNALDRSLLDHLDRALAAAAQDEAVRVIILTGQGDKAFCAGADIKDWMTPGDHEAVLRFIRLGQDIFRRIELCPKPMIAAINGVALGGGLELAMACDLRIAAEEAHLGLPEVTLGAYPGWQGIPRLIRHVGIGRAKQLFMTGLPITASAALNWGLVNQVVPLSKLASETEALAHLLARRGPLALSLGKEVAAFAIETPLAHARLESLGVALISKTEDFVEGVKAFLEKREAQFRGK